MSTRNNQRGRRRRGSRRGRQIPPIDREIVASSRTTGRESTNFPSEDFLRSCPSMALTQTPPRNIRGQIHWIQAQLLRVNTLSNSANTEYNLSFALSDLTAVSGITAFFDQYCLYSVAITVQCNDVGVSATTETGRGYTAIDYDNTGNLGSETAIQAFGTCVGFIPGRSVQQRYIKPVVAPAIYSGSAFTGFGVARAWLDCASTGIPHYGFRSYFAANGVSGLNVDYMLTYVLGFRNNN
jgi:hypothetical protein